MLAFSCDVVLWGRDGHRSPSYRDRWQNRKESREHDKGEEAPSTMAKHGHSPGARCRQPLTVGSQTQPRPAFVTRRSMMPHAPPRLAAVLDGRHANILAEDLRE